MSLPRPATFAEGQRQLFGIAVGVAGITFGLAVLAGCIVIVFGRWAPSLQPTQLYILAGVVAGGCLNTTIVLVGLLLGGPVGRFSVKANKDGAEIDAGAK